MDLGELFELLQQQRNDLLQALKRLSRTYMEHDGSVSTDAMTEARALIARIEGNRNAYGRDANDPADEWPPRMRVPGRRGIR